MKNILTIAKKELQTYFNNPTAYIVVLAFLLLWEFLFFRSAFLVGEASLRGLFDLLPWMLIIVVPALTMGALSEEKSEGTLEFLLTHPINQIQLIAGKFLGILAFFALALLLIFPLAWSFSRYGSLDWGETIVSYLAGVLMAGVLTSLGIFISSLFTSLISAFLVSTVASFFLIISGSELLSARMPLALAPFLDQLSLSNHFSSMSRGVIDARDVWYFVSLTAVFLGLTYLTLIKNKFGNKKSVYRNYQAALILTIGIVVLSNVIGAKIPGRLDLTRDKLYTLSPSTKEIAANLPDIVNINLYASDKLPSQLQPVLRETKDILDDYKNASKGKIKVAHRNPSSDPEVAEEAISLGVQPMRFNVVSQEEFQVKEGYLGIAVSYGGEHESIPFVQNLGDVEYQLSSFLKKLTDENKTKIGFLAGHGEKDQYSDYRMISEELIKQFSVQTITAESESPAASPEEGVAGETPEAPKTFSIPQDIKTIIVAGPTDDFSEDETKVMDEFIQKGGSVFFMIDGVAVSPQSLSASANEKNLARYLLELTGVEVKKDLAYDLKSNETVTFGGGAQRFILPYPFWVRAVKSSNNPITSKIESLLLPWPSTLAIDSGKLSQKKYKKDELFSTTEFSGVQTANFNITPDQDFPSKNLSKNLMAVALSSEGDSDSRILIVGDSDFLTDQYVQSNPANHSFALEAISWLSQESALSRIGVKNISEKKLVFKEKGEPSYVKFGNLAFIFLVTSGYGFIRLSRRKKMKERGYGDEN